jgi:hypothetical protein
MFRLTFSVSPDFMTAAEASLCPPRLPEAASAIPPTPMEERNCRRVTPLPHRHPFSSFSSLMVFSLSHSCLFQLSTTYRKPPDSMPHHFGSHNFTFLLRIAFAGLRLPDTQISFKSISVYPKTIPCTIIVEDPNRDRVCDMKIGEIKAKSILSKSQVCDYASDHYVGCQHGCVYRYAKFMKRSTGRRERWGTQSLNKMSAPGLLADEVNLKCSIMRLSYSISIHPIVLPSKTGHHPL